MPTSTADPASDHSSQGQDSGCELIDCSTSPHVLLDYLTSALRSYRFVVVQVLNGRDALGGFEGQQLCYAFKQIEWVRRRWKNRIWRSDSTPESLNAATSIRLIAVAALSVDAMRQLEQRWRGDLVSFQSALAGSSSAVSVAVKRCLSYNRHISVSKVTPIDIDSCLPRMTVLCDPNLAAKRVWKWPTVSIDSHLQVDVYHSGRLIFSSPFSSSSSSSTLPSSSSASSLIEVFRHVNSVASHGLNHSNLDTTFPTVPTEPFPRSSASFDTDEEVANAELSWFHQHVFPLEIYMRIFGLHVLGIDSASVTPVGEWYPDWRIIDIEEQEGLIRKYVMNGRGRKKSSSEEMNGHDESETKEEEDEEPRTRVDRDPTHHRSGLHEMVTVDVQMQENIELMGLPWADDM